MTKLRSEVPEKDKWNLSDIFKTEADFAAECESLAKCADFSEFEGKLKDADTVLAFLRKNDEISKRMEKVYCYAEMKKDENGADNTAVANMGKAQSLYVKLSAAASFFTPELLSRPQKFLKDLIADPRFSDYDYMLKSLLKEKAHVLSESEEKLLALGGEVYGGYHDVFSVINNVELDLPKIKGGDGKPLQLSHGVYSSCLYSADRDLRKRAFKTYYEAFIKKSNTLATVYACSVKKDVYLAKAKNYDSCLSAALSGEDVDASVYRNLLKYVGKNLGVMHRYIAARKKALGVNQLHMWDLHVPIVKNAELKLEFDDAFQLVKEGLAPLGKDYVALLQRARDERWIDVEETENKRGGAYSCGVYGVHPFVLLNYSKTTSDVFTIAHELGHSLHSYKSSAAQPYAKADYRIFVAEVASTVNEVLLLRHLLKKTTDRSLKKYLLSYYMDTIRTTLFRQTMFAEFEEFAHRTAEEGGPLTRDAFNEFYLELNKKYYGRSVVSDPEIAYEWVRIPHFYTSFYVYKYSTGIISAISIAERILKEGQPAVEDYFRFLSGGGSTDPVSLLRLAGVDLSKKEPFEVAMRSFSDALDEFIALQDEN